MSTPEPTDPNRTITALITCFNRKAHTLACLEALENQNLPANHQLRIVLVDDHSKDGTAEEVARAFPDVEIVHGDGSLFWCGGMRVAWRKAAESDPDFYLLVNDDTLPADDALKTLLAIAGDRSSLKIAVASIADNTTGQVNYGGVGKKTGVLAPESSEPCHTFNANFVLVPRAVYLKCGMLYDAYTHSMGDIDYGIQAARVGVEIVKSSRFLGTCGSNPVSGTWRDRSLPRMRRFTLLQHPKGLPFGEWCAFARRNMGPAWPYYCVSPFLRILLGR